MHNEMIDKQCIGIERIKANDEQVNNLHCQIE